MNKIILSIALSLAFSAAASAQKTKQSLPKDGETFKVAPELPKHVTCDVEFRDPKDEKWPNFFYGKPAAAGTFVWSSKGVTGGFSMNCDKMAQRQGDQDRKVLADILIDGKAPAVAFTATQFGAVTSEKDAKGKPVESFPVRGQLKIGDKTAELSGTGKVKWNYPKDAEFPDHAQLTMKFEVKGTDLGLKSAEPVQVIASAVVYKELVAPPKKK